MTAGQQMLFGAVVGATHVLTAGVFGGSSGFNAVPSTTFYGTLAPANYGGATVRAINDSGALFTVGMSGSQIKSFFNGIRVVGPGYNIVLLTADATGFFESLGNTLWQWASQGPFSNGAVYQVGIT